MFIIFYVFVDFFLVFFGFLLRYRQIQNLGCEPNARQNSQHTAIRNIRPGKSELFVFLFSLTSNLRAVSADRLRGNPMSVQHAGSDFGSGLPLGRNDVIGPGCQKRLNVKQIIGADYYRQVRGQSSGDSDGLRYRCRVIDEYHQLPGLLGP
jgi:hypothetical protein